MSRDRYFERLDRFALEGRGTPAPVAQQRLNLMTVTDEVMTVPTPRSGSRPWWVSPLTRLDALSYLGTGIVKLRPTAVVDTQHGGFTAGSSPVSWGSID